MRTTPLTSIDVEGFTSIRSASVDLRALNVLVGANGAGKSNFVHVFELLSHVVEQGLGLFVGLNGGASALLNSGSEPRLRVSVQTDAGSYEFALLPAANDEFVFEHESVSLDEPRSETGVRSFGQGQRESRLNPAAFHPESREISSVVDPLHSCRVFHFHDTSRNAPVKQYVSTADNLTLRNDAGNLAAVLLYLQSSEDPQDRAAYQRIVRTVQLIAPFFRDFVLVPESSDRVLLRWRQRGSDAVFSANQMSDGTLRFVCLVTLLQQPKLPAVVVLDEPELGLHPSAIVLLADLIKQASARSQVLLATQSVTLMNQFSVQDLIVVERDEQQGGSVFTRPDPERLREWLDEYSLGELWEKHLIGGQPGTRGSITDA
ncbi:AAA family ATPase [Amycolatopsis albispora]|uniref:Chromosome segregation protein SMC n=1 Tax=Amycolatopsis albispora TaxID=1804986 RepID=A0A344LD94_9PSEU|nr:AAA family ATPase [Amycolatopsis albispora]AXB46018.1 chromosome segregation protein SMC [Amycolatopsis albispora]